MLSKIKEYIEWIHKLITLHDEEETDRREVLKRRVIFIAVGTNIVLVLYALAAYLETFK